MLRLCDLGHFWLSLATYPLLPYTQNTAMNKLVFVENVHKEYLLGKAVVPALRGVSLAADAGEFLAISGPSGSGKTTLLNLIGCIEKPTSGDVFVSDQKVSDKSADQLAEIRAHQLGFIFQQFNLLPVLTAFENVEYPLLERKLSKAERRAKVEAALSSVGLASHSHHKPMELSGGQRQRVAIARAIVTEPLLILADEPTANLDHKTGVEILDLMKDLNQKNGTTFIFSTHDPKVIERATRVVKLFDGAVIDGAVI